MLSLVTRNANLKNHKRTNLFMLLEKSTLSFEILFYFIANLVSGLILFLGYVFFSINDIDDRSKPRKLKS